MTFYEKYKHLINPVAIIVVLSAMIYGSLHFFFLRNDDSLNEHRKTEIEIAQDSIAILHNEIAKLKIVETKLTTEVDGLKSSLKNTDKQETIIREYHYEKIKYVDRYTPTDINVYFDKRYGPDSITVHK